jgi:hypothetical protein
LLFASATLTLTLTTGCAHSASAPAAAATNAPAETKAEHWCGPIVCPSWLVNEPLERPLPLRERCALLSKVLMYQPLKMVGRPLSAHETSLQKSIARIGGRVAVAVTLRPAQPEEQEPERTWFGAAETCGAGLLVLAPSLTQGDPEQASSIFHLALTVPDPERPNAFEFVLSAEALQPGASVAAWEPLAGRIERSRDAGPDSWTVVHASVASGNEPTQPAQPAQPVPQAAAPQNPAAAAQPAAGEPAPESAVTE